MHKNIAIFSGLFLLLQATTAAAQALPGAQSPAWQAPDEVGNEPENTPSMSTVPGVSPGKFYAVGNGEGDGSSNLYSFNYSNNQIQYLTHIGETGAVLVDVALHPVTSVLYAIDENGALYTLDKGTGVRTYLGSTGRFINALEICNGVLYGWGAFDFVAINPANAQVTFLSHPTYGSSGDLMCDRASGTLYGIATSSGNNVLVVFNTYYGFNSYIGVTLPSTNFYGGAIDSVGQMYVAREWICKVGWSFHPCIQLHHVDRTTGVTTRVGQSLSLYGLYGLTITPLAW